MCCVLPVFAEAGSSPLRGQFSTSSMLTPAAFYVLHSFDTIPWNGLFRLFNSDRRANTFRILSRSLASNRSHPFSLYARHLTATSRKHLFTAGCVACQSIRPGLSSCTIVQVLNVFIHSSCCSSLVVLINMSCSDGSFDLSSEYGAELCSQSLDSGDLSDSDQDPLPDSASAVSASDQDLLPDSASVGSAISSEASSGRCALHEPPKTPVRQKRRLRMIEEDKDRVRIKVIPSLKQKFCRQMQQTNHLQDDFFLPNRAQLVLNFLKNMVTSLLKKSPVPRSGLPRRST